MSEIQGGVVGVVRENMYIRTVMRMVGLAGEFNVGRVCGLVHSVADPLVRSRFQFHVRSIQSRLFFSHGTSVEYGAFLSLFFSSSS